MWGIIAVLAILWLLGFTMFHIGPLIHIVLVIAVIMLVVNLLTGRKASV